MEKIKIEKNEELGSVLSKLGSSKETDVIFSIADGAIMLQSVINLKILKKRAEELGKSVTIERNREEIKPIFNKDLGVENNANKGIPKKNIAIDEKKGTKGGFEKKESGLRDNDRPVQIPNTVSHVKMFDIVKKVDAPSPKVSQGPAYGKIEEKKIVVEKKYPEARGFIPQDAVRAQPARIERDISKTGKRKIRLPSIMSKIFYIFILVVVATALISAAMTLPKVNIDIKLKSDLREYDLNLIVDDTADNIDADKGIIPAKKEEVNEEMSETYPSTGKKHIVSKASGKITIYNEYSSSDQKIVATTRFLSKDGHMFRVEENVTIPGFTRVEGKDVPGEVTVDVIADKAGEEYNIAATSFTIPGYQGGMKYSTIYARSSAAMSGGADREAIYFSESDYITAKEKLVKAVRDKNDQDITGKKTDSYLLLNGTRKEDDVKIATDVKIGDIADKFKMTASIKETGLFVNKDNINEIVDWKIKSETGKDVEILGDRKYSNDLEITKNENGAIILPITVSQNVVAKIDVDKIKGDIYNKSEDEVRAYFSSIKEFSSVNVTFSWTKNVPSSNDKINIVIEK